MSSKMWAGMGHRLLLSGTLCLLVFVLGQSATLHAASYAAGEHAFHHMAHAAYSPGVGDGLTTGQPDVISDYYDDLLMVEFGPEYAVRLRGGEFVDLNERADPAELARLAQMGAWERAYTVDEDFIDETRRQAEAIKGEPMPDLNNYYYFYLPDGWDMDETRARLLASPLIDFAERIPVAYPTQEVPDYTDFTPGQWYQRYLDAAPDGIDARWAWMGHGGRGQDVRICNIEYGYNPSHVDLPPITVLGTPYIGNFEEHGTSVMGIMGGRDNGFGVTGIAPSASYYFAFVGPNNTLQNAHQTRIQDAILRCLNALRPGDIILVEQQIAGPNRPLAPAEGDQRGLVAVDWFKPYYDAAQIASAMVLVVEAAGNGREWLDDFVYQQESTHNPFVPATGSGALIVGAGNSPYLAAWDSDFPARAASGFTNHGSIVRMQGWGDLIVAPGGGTLFPGEDEDENIDPAFRNQFYTLFAGTSGASPIVVGAAAAIQGVHKSAFGFPLLPNQLIALMRETGTPQQGANIVGPLPNIRGAVEKMFADNNVGLTPAPPVLTPGAGTYNMPMQIQIAYGHASQNLMNTVIRFTLDGSEPGFEEGWQFVPEETPHWTMNYGATLKVKAFQYDEVTRRWFPSETVTAAYVSTTPTVSPPNIILPGPGPEFISPLEVTLSTFTPDATIRYRTDGKNISFFYPGTLYTGPFSLGPGEYTIVARAYKDGHYKSDLAKTNELVVIAPQLPPPLVSPQGGSYNSGVTVSMSHSVPGAEIRYTTDGSNVTPSNSTLYVEPFWLEQSVNLRARAFREGYQPSTQVIHNFDITETLLPPKFTPASGEYAGSVNVTIAPPMAATEVRYTTNGAEPTGASPLYSGPFTLGIGEHTVKAKAFNGRILVSETASAVYTVYDPNPAKVAAPVFSPHGGNHTGSVTIAMSSATEGATIRYTLSPLEPENQWLTYSDPITLGPDPDGYVIRAKAYRSGMADSDFTQASFHVFSPVGTVETPWITPPSGGYSNTVQVTIHLTRTPPMIVPMIYHTTNGSTPVVPPNTAGQTPPYSFNVSAPTQVKAIGAQLGYHNSAVVEAEYFFYCAMPTLTPGGFYTDTVAVSMSTATQNATIRYTTDGSTPTQQSPQYTGPINLGVGETTVRARCFRSNFDPSPIAQQLYIVSPAPTPPSFAEHPTDVNVPPGAPVILEGALAGGNPETARYQWQHNGVNLVGANEPRLEIPAAREEYAGDYRLLVTTAGGQVQSQEAALMLTDAAIAGLIAGSNSPTLLNDETQFFTQVSSGTGISYSWDFGDGNASDEPSPSHIYNAVGNYNVEVTATNAINQMTAQLTVVVTDTSASIAGLAASNSGPSALGAATRFSATVSEGTSVSYVWDFGDNQGGVGPIPTHVYTQTGAYTATVTASNNAGPPQQAQTVVTVFQPSQPIQGLAASNNGPTMLGQPTQFNATIAEGANVSFSWDFDDGNMGSGPSPSHAYAAPGVYTAKVTASNDLGSQEAATVVTVVDGNLPIQTLTVSADSPTELGEATQFTASSDGTGVTYAWQFGDGATGSGAAVSHVYTSTGTYLATVRAHNDKSEREESVPVVVQVTPLAIEAVDFTYPDEMRVGQVATFRATVGAGSSVAYAWDFGDGTTGSGAVANHAYTEPGLYTVRLTASNSVNEETVTRAVTVQSAGADDLAQPIYLPMVDR